MWRALTRFNEIRRGVPRISATLLKNRLLHLESAGIVTRRPSRPKGYEEYFLTEAGTELKPILSAIGTWGQRWAREIDDEDLDPAWLVWAMHRRIDTAAMPDGRTVLAIYFTDALSHHRLFWLVCDHPRVDVCIKPPGFDEDLRIEVDVRTMAAIWRGIHPIGHAVASGALTIEGTPTLVERAPSWLLLSVFAETKRAAG